MKKTKVPKMYLVDAKEAKLKEHSAEYGILFDLVRRSSNETEVITDRLITELESMGPFPKTLLDVGASDGRISQVLYPHLNKVVAVERHDFDVFALETLGIEAHPIDWESFTTDEKFDIVLASHMIYNFSKEKYYEQSARMQDKLKDHGKVVFIMNSHQNEYADLLNGFYSRVNGGKQAFSHSRVLEDTLTDHNIALHKETLPVTFSFLNETHFVNMCRFFLGYKREYINEVIQDLEAHYINKLQPAGEKTPKKMRLDLDYLTIGK